MVVPFVAIPGIQTFMELPWSCPDNTSFSQVVIAFGNFELTYLTHIKHSPKGSHDYVPHNRLFKNFWTLRLFNVEVSPFGNLKFIYLVTEF